MRPIRLEVNHFGPFLGEHVIDFETLARHGLFLIHGPTGAGKSTILDALCFALFGEASGVEKDGRDLATTLQQQERTKVVLEFEHLGRRYRVTRHPGQKLLKQRGEGTTEKGSEGSLEELESGRVLAANTSGTTAEIQGMLHCTAKQFRQTVVLPQGAFRKVITDHDERRKILANIFETDRFAAFSERIKKMEKRFERRSEALENLRQELLSHVGANGREDLEAKLGFAAEESRRLAAVRQEAAVARDRRLAEVTAAGTLSGRFDEADRLRAAQSTLQQRVDQIDEARRRVERARRAEQLTDARANLESARAESASLLEELERTRSRLADAKAESAEAALHLETERAREPERLRADAERSRLEAQEEQVGRLAEMRSRETELRAAVERAADELREHRSSLASEEERRGALAARQLELSRELGAEAGLERKRGPLEQQVGDLAEIARLRNEIAGILKDIEELRADGDPAESIAVTIGEHAPGLLAGSLRQGEACPVCGSEHHPGPADGSVSFERLREAFERFGEARERISRLEEKRRNCAERVAELARRHDWSPEELPELAERRAALAEVESSLEALRRFGEEAKRVEAGLAGIEERLPGLRTRVEESQDERAEVELALSGHAGALMQLLAQIAPEHHDPDSFSVALAEARERHGRLQQALRQANERALEARGRVETAENAERLLAGKFDSAEEKRGRLETEFLARLHERGFADLRDLDDASVRSDELAALEHEVREYDEALAQTMDRLGQLEKQLEGRERPDLEALEAAHLEARADYERADGEWREVDSQRVQLERIRERLDALESRHGRLRERIEAARKLSKLASGTLAGRSRVDFETFVLQSIFHQVLSVGNRHLKHMTAGRYALHLRYSEAASAKGLELDVSDHQGGGQLRPVHTLSGGEGFLASLALALGLSEIAQRTSGGTELGALFVDEGFGSLDPRSLDQAVRILRDLPQDHRMVGVISHVEELKRRIPVQLLVEATERGSRVGVRVNE